MKYTTPSIEVVTFNPQDAARIGMQWWAEVVDSQDYIALPDTFDTTGLELRSAQIDKSPFFTDLVASYRCNGVTYPGAFVWHNPTLDIDVGYFVDDLKSC